jgi:hypothetical protein
MTFPKHDWRPARTEAPEQERRPEPWPLPVVVLLYIAAFYAGCLVVWALGRYCLRWW